MASDESRLAALVEAIQSCVETTSDPSACLGRLRSNASAGLPWKIVFDKEFRSAHPAAVHNQRATALPQKELQLSGMNDIQEKLAEHEGEIAECVDRLESPRGRELFVLAIDQALSERGH